MKALTWRRAVGICMGILAIALAGPAASLAGKPAKPSPPAMDTKGKQTPPIKLGTSGGWAYDLANGYCCGGTLGALVTDGTLQYILSNFHVLAADTALGGNGIIAQIGDPVIQPGLIDVGCLASGAQTVGLLAAYADPLDGLNIDAALAVVVPGMVDETGAILGIGALSSATAPAVLKQRVKKTGRTTGLTASTVQGLNATIQVLYDTECAGSDRGVATFTGQILVANRGSKFLAAGDSGSLLVEDVAQYPRAIGLLYAGSSQIAVANPINDVLTAFGVSMVGVAGAADVAAAGQPAEPGLAAALQVQRQHGRKLEAMPGAVGHAIGADDTGRPVILLLVEQATPAIRAAAPRSLDGVRVIVEEVGRVVAF